MRFFSISVCVLLSLHGSNLHLMNTMPPLLYIRSHSTYELHVSKCTPNDLSNCQLKKILCQITRGSTFTFGVHFTVTGCKSPNLRGHDCSVTVKPLCYETSAPSLASRQNRKLTLEAMLTQQLVLNHLNATPNLNQPAGEESWKSLKSQHVGPKEWKLFALEIADFVLRLQVRAVCTSPNCNITTSAGQAKIYLKYGALPQDEGDDNGTTVIGSAPLSISVPRRGPWYIGVHNSNVTQGLDFDLYWRVESCSYGTAGDSCAAAMNSMEVPKVNSNVMCYSLCPVLSVYFFFFQH